jgi:hypothetical protein
MDDGAAEMQAADMVLKDDNATIVRAVEGGVPSMLT